MSDFVEVKTAELTGPALDWAVAKVEGVAYNAKYLVQTKCNMAGHIQSVKYTANYLPSIGWAQGGPLRDKYKVDITEGDHAVSASILTESCECANVSGPTALIALCRAIVAANLGEVVRVPAELAGVAA